MKIGWITHNLWLKLWALVLAIGLWFYVAGEETVQVDLKIPIELLLAEGMGISEQSVDKIEVTVSGRKEIVSKLSEDKLISRIDLTHYMEPKTLVLPVDRKYLPLNPEINILHISPERIEVKIDRLVQKLMPVRVQTVGEPAPGYRVEGFIIDPISVLIKGPEGYLKDLVYIDTEPVDVTGRQKSFKKMVPLKSVPMIGNKEPSQFIEVVVKISEGGGR